MEDYPVVDEETLKENSFDPKKFYKKHPELNIAPLTGRSKRKLIRQNTVHLRAICPNCGKTNIRYSSHAKKWYCKKCNKFFKRNELEYVRYS